MRRSLSLGLVLVLGPACSTESTAPDDGQGGAGTTVSVTTGSSVATGAAPTTASSAATGSGTTGGAGGAGGADDAIIPAEVGCAPRADACAAAAVDDAIVATYRKDAYLDDSYAEPNDAPVDGGRVQIAAIASVTGAVTQVLIDGVDVATIDQPSPATPAFEWAHVWPTDLVAGEPVYVGFHSRLPHWDSAATASLTIVTDGGTAVAGAFPVAPTKLPLTYVTTSDDLTSFFIHARNDDGVAHTVTGLSLNGRQVLESGIACVADPVLDPGESLLVEVPLCEPATIGGVWTVSVSWADAPPSVGGGRVLRPHFPIETWMTTSDCALPGGDAQSYQAHREAGIDTVWFHGGTCNQCSCELGDVLDQAAMDGYHLLVTDDVVGPSSAIADTTAIAGVATGDESDGEIYGDDGVPNPANKARKAREVWGRYPELSVYNGGKTNRNVGTFAGMTDIQGMDFYVAACAPHITAWGTHPPIQAAYDYLLNTRENMMPLPTWLYAQGLHPGWNREVPVLGTEIHVQPDPAEILVQGMSVLAAGAKGFMWFQSTMSEADAAPERWEAMAKMGRMVRGVRQWARTGDLASLASSSDPDVLASAVRADRAVIVSAIDFAVETAPTDVGCAAIYSDASVPHWVLATREITLAVEAPRDFAVRDVFEITAEGQTIDVPAFDVVDRTLSIPGVVLDHAMPVRLFVLAADEVVRQEAMQQMTY